MFEVVRWAGEAVKIVLRCHDVLDVGMGVAGTADVAIARTASCDVYQESGGTRASAHRVIWSRTNVTRDLPRAKTGVDAKPFR
ncbi:uncharacterized protein N7511_009155 [Penicillium nucicola]|uniref:uncharacterized protein n=1 Tax=Penicillium nucicola TaxID=1850975 RepID=UPI002545BC06|nr:uncharacterized protein N7511_009155 [Penicillium nucicola]KAJ5747459.1 hypothetical protein N7511_009155 [Penicillium nucicola]